MAQTAVWTGSGANTNYTTPGNWQGGTVPPNDGSTTIEFNNPVEMAVNIQANVLGLSLFNSGSWPYVYRIGSGSLTIGSGGITSQANNSYIYISAPIILSASQTWNPAQTDGWGWIEVDGDISETGGSRALTIGGGGSGFVDLFGNNSFSGGLNVALGAVYLGSSTAAGTGAINLASDTTLETYSSVGLANPVTLGNDVWISAYYYLGQPTNPTFTGPVTFATATPTLNLYEETSLNLSGTLGGPIGTMLTIWGSGAKLPVDYGSQVILQGTLNNIAGITVLNSGLILAPAGSPSTSFASIGATGLLVGNADNIGYLGLDGNFTQTGAVAAFLSKYGATMGASINGTLGFDTFANPTSPNVFNDPINLSSFTSPNFLGLGSVSAAILGPGATITPYNSAYLFGGGGGTLTVQSPLANSSGTTSLTMTSAPEPLTLILQGTNTYTGGTVVNGGVLIFDSALPTYGTISLNSGGYVGYTENANVDGAQLFVGRISASNPGGVIGFDSADISSPRTISDSISLSGFSSENNPFIGTATAVTLTGTITPAANTFQFTGVKGGSLTVDSALTGENSVVIGLNSPIETNGSISSVTLTGTNSYSGGTTLISGTLFVSGASPLGSGPVSVPATASNNLPPTLAPASGSGTVTLVNNFSVGNRTYGPYPGLTLGNASTSDMLVLSGVISDFSESLPGMIAIQGPVTLGGVNTYTGGTTIPSSNAQVLVANSSSLGTGPLTVEYDGGMLAASGGNVTLSNPIAINSYLTLGPNGTNTLTLNGVISGYGSLFIDGNVDLGGANTFSEGTFIGDAAVMISNASAFGTGPVQLSNSTLGFSSMNLTLNDLIGDPASVVDLGLNSTLTLYTDSDSTYSYGGQIIGNGTDQIVKTGPGIQILTGTATYGGGTTVSAGALIAGSNTALGAGSVTVNSGAALGLSSNVTLANPVSFEIGGAIAGYGTFAPTSASSFAISGGSTIAGGNGTLGSSVGLGQVVGTLSFGPYATVEFGPQGVMQFSIMNATGTPGTDYSAIDLAGNLNITATQSNPFTIQLVGVDTSNTVIGIANTFDPTQSYTWTLLSAGSISMTGGFNPLAFAVDSSTYFSNPTNGGQFAVSETILDGSADLTLNFTPVPEPSTWLLMASGLCALGAAVRRRRR